MTTSTTHLFDLFISYAAADREWVEGYLFDTLKAASVRYFSDAAFQLGVPRLVEFERGVKQSKRTLLVLSPAYMSDNVAQFVDILAQSYGLDAGAWSVIPLILQPVPLPPRLALLTPLDATDPDGWDQTIDRLFAALQTPVPGPAVKPSCPYPGMAPFRAEESAYFFGREAEVELLLQQLRHHPFITIIGPSGSGKSSLVFAGLLPALQRSGLFGEGSWAVRTMRPGEHPLAALQHALGVMTLEQLELAALLTADPAAKRLLLIVDQFEELFTLGIAEAASFLQGLQQLMDLVGCYVVLTVRADFYTELITSPLWGEIQQHRLEITPLDEEGLRQAIVRPAEQVGVYIESALVERLLANAAGEPGVLPFLQEVLVLLWEKLERRFLPLHAYEALVLPYTALTGEERTGLQVAMAQKADAIFNKLTPAQQAIARRIFLRLVQFGEGRQDTRRQQPVSALRVVGEEDERFAQTLHYLAENRLLTISGEGQGDPKVDLSHEAMIEGWPLLKMWVTQRRTAELTRRRLEGKATEWERFGKGEGGLLDATELAEAREWLMSADAGDLGVSTDLAVLVEASQRAINPGWHRWGTVALCTLAFSWIGAIGLLRIYTQELAVVLRTTVWLVAGLTTVLVLGALLRPGDPYRLQKFTHRLHHPIILPAIFCCLALLSGIWIRFAYGYLQLEQACVARYGERPAIDENKVGIVNTALHAGLDPYYFILLSNILSTYQSIQVQRVAAADVTPCMRLFTHLVEIEEQRLPDQQRKFIAKIDSQYDNDSAVYSENGEVSCQLFAEFAHRIAVGLSLQKPSAIKDADVATVSCVAFELNEQGYQAYYQAITLDYEQQPEQYTARQLRLLDDAQRKLEQAITASRDQFAVPHNNLAQVYLIKGAIDELDDGQTEYYLRARDEFSRAVQLLPGFASYVAQLAYTCQLVQDWSCAEVRYKEIIQLEPAQSIHLLRFANVYLDRGDFVKGEIYLRQAEEQLNSEEGSDQPTQAQYELQSYLHLTQAKLAFGQADWQSAVAFAQQAIQAGGVNSFEEIAYYLTMSHLALLGDDSESATTSCVHLQGYATLPSQYLPGEFMRRQDAQAKARELGCS